MTGSINTNFGALVALQSLTSTQNLLLKTQNEVSSGLKVANASDNGAVYSIAQTERGQVSNLDVVTSSLNTSNSILSVTTSAGGQITDLLNQLSNAALSAESTGISDSDRQKYNAQFTSLLAAVTNAANGAVFNGKSLINASASTTHATTISALGSTDASIKLSSTGHDLTAAGLGLTALSLSTATKAASAATTIATALASALNTVAQYGVDQNSITNQLQSVSNLQDALNVGIGNLVDANVAAESAQLTALQTKQQLGIQALSIANSSTSSLLSLFR